MDDLEPHRRRLEAAGTAEIVAFSDDALTRAPGPRRHFLTNQNRVDATGDGWIVEKTIHIDVRTDIDTGWAGTFA